MPDMNRKIFDWSKVKSWVSDTFSLNTHNHDEVYVKHSEYAVNDDHTPDWSKIRKVYFSWGNSAVQPIIHALVPGTWIMAIQGCGGSNPIFGLLAATKPDYLLGSTARNVNENGVVWGSDYTPALDKVLALNYTDNHIGSGRLDTHLIPGTSTYLRPSPTAQCTNHPFKVYFVPDKCASNCDVYYRIVGCGANFAYDNFSNVFANKLVDLYRTVLAGDWKTAFTNNICNVADDRSLEYGHMFMRSNDDWKSCYPTHVPDKPMVETDANFKYTFVGDGKNWRIRLQNGRRYLEWEANDGDGYPYGQDYLPTNGTTGTTLNQTDTYKWEYQYMKSSAENVQYTTEYMNLRLYKMLDETVY